jgi:hypothetical protein
VTGEEADVFEVAWRASFGTLSAGKNLSRLGRYQTSPGRQSQLIGAVMSSLGVVAVRRTRT